MEKRKHGFTLVELLVVVAIIALLISILLPSLSRAREETKRTACKANIAGIGKACYIYQDENLGIFPTAADAINTTGGPLISYIGYMGGHANLTRETASQRTGNMPSTELSTSRSLWLMVRSGAVVPKNFLCPSSDEVADPTADVTRYYDFIGYGALSFGYQIPYDDLNTCKPSVDVDPRMALMADKSPWSARGDEAASPGVPFTGPEWFKDTISTFAGALYTNGNDGLTDANCAGATLGECNDESPPEKWKRFNSANHGGPNQGAGQNVLFPDGHASWYAKATAGVDHDNIYTQMQTPDSGGGGAFWKNVQWGKLPDAGGKTYPGADSMGPDTNGFTDTLLWP
jgi:prepilin-type N-terminal cleavage/methylation domain-containing protein